MALKHPDKRIGLVGWAALRAKKRGQADAKISFQLLPIRAYEPARIYSQIDLPISFHYWRGASGKPYLHLVYSLLGCPAVPRANYVLVRSEVYGRCVARAFGQTKSDATSSQSRTSPTWGAQ